MVQTYRTLRLPPAIFQQLLEMVEPHIKKQDTVMRKSIPRPPEKHLAITLKYLATGGIVQLDLLKDNLSARNFFLFTLDNDGQNFFSSYSISEFSLRYISH